jgi:hypothetical protein
MATTDGTMAVWGLHINGGTDASAEVHFNYWRISADGTFKPTGDNVARDFVEVGVRLINPAQVDTIGIYLPGQHWEVEDVSTRFVRPDIVQGIFNTQLSGALLHNPSRVEVARPNGDRFCRIHGFPPVNGGIDLGHLTSTTIVDGTLLKITRHALEEVALGLPPLLPAYFRLRAYLDPHAPSPFVKDIVPRDRRFQTGYEVVDYLDFRLNEARSLPTQIEELMRAGPGPRVPTTMVAFLTAVPVQANVTTSSLETHKMRLLEQSWNDYVPGGIPPGMMVYHWKRELKEGERDIEDFSAFVKMATRVSNRKTLLWYLVVAFLFGVAGNLTASAIWEYGKPTAYKLWDYVFPASAKEVPQRLPSAGPAAAITSPGQPAPPLNSPTDLAKPETSTK